MPTVDTDGKTLYYEIAGEGKPLMLVHAALLHSGMWDTQMEAFAPHFQVIRHDVYGYGKSHFTDQKKINHAEDIKALLETLGHSRASILGASMGGEVAMNFALEYPDMVDRLILVGTGLEGYDYPESAFAWWGGFIEAIQSQDLQRAAATFIDHALIGEKLPPALRQQLETMMQDYTFRHYVDPELLWWSPDPPPAARLDALTHPTLVLVGEKDIPVIHAVAEVLAKYLPNVRKQIVPDAAHLVNLEQPEAFNRFVLQFLK